MLLLLVTNEELRIAARTRIAIRKVLLGPLDAAFAGLASDATWC